MKKVIPLLLLITLSLSCSKNLIPNTKGDDSLIGKINHEIKSRTIGEEPIILLLNDTVDSEQLNLLNEFPLSDFTSINFISMSEATKKYGKAGKNGAVVIEPFVDETLTMKYYEGINNALILQNIDATVKQRLTKQNPIIVLDGHPLRGDEIVSKINELGPDGIKQIDVLKKKPGYRIYGVRAINGVILVTTK